MNNPTDNGAQQGFPIFPIVLLGVGACIIGVYLANIHHASNELEQEIAGHFFQTGKNAAGQNTISPSLGIKFLNSSEADFYQDGKRSGDRCRYNVWGEDITIPTSCNTIHIRKEGDHFIFTDSDWYGISLLKVN